MALFNEDLIKGKWKEIKGELQNQWGELTSDDLERSKGNIGAITGLIQQKYGMKKEEVSEKLHKLLHRFDPTPDRGEESFQSKVADGTENVKNNLRNH